MDSVLFEQIEAKSPDLLEKSEDYKKIMKKTLIDESNEILQILRVCI